MEDADGQGMPLGAERLGALLHDEANTLRLVVLNACHGVRTSQDYPFAGLVQGVVREGIQAVVAMQFAITDDAAIIFAREYYRAIADGYPVDAVFGEARKAIYLDDNEVGGGISFLTALMAQTAQRHRARVASAVRSSGIIGRRPHHLSYPNPIGELLPARY